MTSLYEFMSQSNTPEMLALPGPQKSESTLMVFNSVKSGITKLALSGVDIPSSDAERFGQDVAKLVTSDSFLIELSKEIQTPMLGETEDEFVSRAKRKLFGLIDKHLEKQ